MFKLRPNRAVLCLHCTRWFRVPSKAMTVTCPHCSAHVRVDDVVIDHQHQSPDLLTCGRITINKHGSVIARNVTAGGGITCEGSIQAQTVTAPSIYLGPKARWSGNCIAASIVVVPGASIRGGRFQIASTPSPAKAVSADAASAAAGHSAA